jgi:hypothetical protein
VIVRKTKDGSTWQVKVIAGLEGRVRRREGSAKMIKYNAWMAGWLRKHPLPPMTKRDIYLTASRAWREHRRQVEKVKRSVELAHTQATISTLEESEGDWC